MSRIATDVTWVVGNTPLLELTRLSPPSTRLLAKLEFLNPGGSNKVRAALGMILHAERSGFLRSGGTIVECSSGDLGIAIAMIGRRRGHRVILTMPEGLGQRRTDIARLLGAEIVATPVGEGMRGAMARTEQLVKEIPGAVCLQAFTNRANSRIHAETTAREIWQDTDGKVDIVVVPVGTGGTAAGCVAFLRELGVAVVGVEPARSPVLRGGAPGPHDIPGIGAGFVPDILVPGDLAEIVPVQDAEAVAAVRRLAAEEAVLAGPASGAALHAALVLARRPEHAGKMIVVILPDAAERHLDHCAYRLDN